MITQVFQLPLALPIGIRTNFCLLPRLFTTTSQALMLQNHRLFAKVDWEKVDAGYFAVVDPVQPGQILYLTEQDYIKMISVTLTNNRTLKVLASPGENPENISSSSQNSPSDPVNHPFLEELYIGKQTSRKRARDRVRHLFHSVFSSERAVNMDGEPESMINVTSRNARTWISKWYDIVSFWSRGKLMSTVAAAERSTFSRKIYNTWRCNGINHLIKTLKIMNFVIYTYLGGKKLTSTADLGFRVRLTNGLPVALPLYARHGIRAGSRHFIHIWTSVTNSYKALKGEYGSMTSVLETIEKPHPDLSGNAFLSIFITKFVPLFWRHLCSLGVRQPNLLIDELFSTSKAGPNHPNAILGSARDAEVWFEKPEMSGFPDRNLIREWFALTGNTRLDKIFRMSHKMRKLNSEILSSFSSSNLRPVSSELMTGMEKFMGKHHGCLARLHALYEAAGKIRIVAIVDYWTNLALKPLHDWMFSILAKIPQDATFDQEGAVKRFASRGYKTVWSIDLTAATDSIPVQLYRVLFSGFLPKNMVDLWLEILVARPFVKPREMWLDPKGDWCKEDLCHYGTGQPMGALTSWSAMALVHHALVQYSAWKVAYDTYHLDMSSSKGLDAFAMRSLTWFVAYLVLGDDVVIADARVARKYLEVLESFGIKAGMHKSFISDIGMFNFANQTYVGETNVSPLSMKEYVSVSCLAGRAELAMRAVNRGWVDITGTSWVAPLVKLFVTPKVWTAIQLDLQKGRTHPIVSWILSVLLVPGSARFAETVLPKASIKTYLATMLRKALIWNKPLGSIDSLVNEWRSWAVVRSILTKMVNKTYDDFLKNRLKLKEFKGWLTTCLSNEVEDVVTEILQTQTERRMADWAKKYRLPLKELQVTLSLPAIQPHTLEWGSGKSLTEATQFTVEASNSLPIIPDYATLDLDELVKARIYGDDQRTLDLFYRIYASLGATEHLYSHATPGIFLPSSSDVDSINTLTPIKNPSVEGLEPK